MKHFIPGKFISIFGRSGNPYTMFFLRKYVLINFLLVTTFTSELLAQELHKGW